MKKVIVVGCGASGSIIARRLVEDLDCKVDIIERRPHIAGNMYDERDEHGFLIQKYGPHHWYTSNYKIYHYIEQFGDFFSHYYKSKNLIDGQYVTMPFNFYTIQEMLGREKADIVIRHMREKYGSNERVPVIDMVNCDDPVISEYANLLFDKAFKTYVSKMWDIPMDKVDAYVLGRRAFVAGYDERVADYDYQGLPKEGFTKLFEKMLDLPNINVQLNVDALEHISFADNKVLYDGEVVDCLVYTGNIDELFNFKFGKLPYRSLDIKFDYYPDNEDVLPTEGVSYPQEIGFTRKIEYRKMMYDTSKLKGSVVSTEYPVPYDKDAKIGNVPYYPVVTEESQLCYQKYVEEAKKYGNIFLCGRLAEFKYIDMHTCVEHALDYSETIKNYLNAL